jgi:hypothetical protein
MYIQCRTATLATRYIILAFYDIYQEFMDASLYFQEDVELWWGIANCVVVLCVLVYCAVMFTDQPSRASIDMREGTVMIKDFAAEDDGANSSKLARDAEAR